MNRLISRIIRLFETMSFYLYYRVFVAFLTIPYNYAYAYVLRAVYALVSFKTGHK